MDAALVGAFAVLAFLFMAGSLASYGDKRHS